MLHIYIYNNGDEFEGSLAEMLPGLCEHAAIDDIPGYVKINDMLVEDNEIKGLCAAFESANGLYKLWQHTYDSDIFAAYDAAANWLNTLVHYLEARANMRAIRLAQQ